jgi:hypothetical protein
MQLYFGDWRKNAKLRRCSPAARGYWIDIMGVLHDSEEYGLVHWPLKELARAADTPMRYVRELVDKGVLKGSDNEPVDYSFTPTHGRAFGQPVKLIENRSGACWFSSRMVRDEYVRKIRGSSSRFSHGDAVSPSPKVGIGDAIGDGFGSVKGDGASASASASALDLASVQALDLEASTQLSRAGVRTAVEKAEQPERPADAACRVMAEAGVSAQYLNPEHPFLIQALAAGAQPAMFAHPAQRAIKDGKQDPFAYACKAVIGQIEDARKRAPEPERKGGPMALGAILKRLGGGAAT